MNANLAEYLAPVNADVGAVEAIIVPEDDSHVNEIGVMASAKSGSWAPPPGSASAIYLSRPRNFWHRHQAGSRAAAVKRRR